MQAWEGIFENKVVEARRYTREREGKHTIYQKSVKNFHRCHGSTHFFCNSQKTRKNALNKNTQLTWLGNCVYFCKFFDWTDFFSLRKEMSTIFKSSILKALHSGGYDISARAAFFAVVLTLFLTQNIDENAR